MSKASQPELKKVSRCPRCLHGHTVANSDAAPFRQFMDKKLFVHLQGGRKVSGTLRGYDLFLNLVIDDALEETNPAQKHPIGTVVRCFLSEAVSAREDPSLMVIVFVGDPRQQRHLNGDLGGSPVTSPRYVGRWTCSVSYLYCYLCPCFRGLSMNA